MCTAPMSQKVASERRSRAVTALAAAALLALALAPASSAFTAAAAAPRGLATAVSTGTSLAGAPLLGSRDGQLAALARRAAEDDAKEVGVRVGVLAVKGSGVDLKAELEKLNVNTSSCYFQTEVPDSFQIPIAAKWLAMSQTVDVIVAAHGAMSAEALAETLRTYQSVSLNFNVPLVPFTDGADTSEQVAATAVQMAEIRMQALMGSGPRQSQFFGIGTKPGDDKAPAKKEKVYF